MTFVPSLWDPTANSGNATPAQWDLYNPVWAAEVQEARTSNLFVPRMLRNIRSWYQANGTFNREVEFVQTGKIGSERHEKGDIITGTSRHQIKKSVTIDDRPYRAAITDEYITRMFEQPNTRQGITTSLGQALAVRQEVEAMKAIALAARYVHAGSEPAEFLQGGNAYANASTGWTYDYGFNDGTEDATAALNVLKAIRNQVKVWDKQNVPAEGRYCLLNVDLWYEVRDLEKVGPSGSTTINGGIYGNTDIVGPKLSFAQYYGYATPLEYMGVQIFRHNLFKATYDENIGAFSANRTTDTERAGNFTNTAGLLFQSGAVGFVDVMGTAFKVEQVPLTTNETVHAMNWMGAGTIRPEYAVELVQS